MGLNSAVGKKKSYFVRVLQQQHRFQSHLNTKLSLIVTHVMWMGEGWGGGGGGGGGGRERGERRGQLSLAKIFFTHPLVISESGFRALNS